MCLPLIVNFDISDYNPLYSDVYCPVKSSLLTCQENQIENNHTSESICEEHSRFSEQNITIKFQTENSHLFAQNLNTKLIEKLTETAANMDAGHRDPSITVDEIANNNVRANRV